MQESGRGFFCSQIGATAVQMKPRLCVKHCPWPTRDSLSLSCVHATDYRSSTDRPRQSKRAMLWKTAGISAAALVAGLATPTNAFVPPAGTPAGRRAMLRGANQPLSLRSPHHKSLLTKSASKGAKATALTMGIFDTLKKAVGGGEKEMETVVFGVGDAENQQLVNGYLARVEQKINSQEDALEKLSDAELRSKTDEFRARLANGESEDDILEDAFAVVREAAWRVLKMRHYDVQLAGGMALQQGRLAEMATGEGKTLVASLPSYLNALSGKGVHVVTVNDYLARRDAENIGQIHRFLGLSVGLIQSYMEPQERRENYSKDITYVTNSELGFDYLRDNLALNEDQIVLARGFNYCIVDEADSILVDEARTPLIISEKTVAPVAKYSNSAKIASVLEEKVHYVVDEKSQAVTLTERGFADVERILSVKDLFNPKDPWSPYIINALKAKSLFKKDVQYVVRGTEIMIVDEFTGRVLEGRRWSNGLHQSVEAKEGLQPSQETQTVASITYQSFFRLYKRLSGMSGTAITEAKEFMDIYGLPVTCIPTALPVARRDNADAVFRTQNGKWKAVMGDIARRHTKGQPILVGTTSVLASQELSKLLTELKVPHEVLNAESERAGRESEIVAQAGRAFAITIATNMAGRGTDILLGGNPSFFAKKRIMQKLCPVLLTKQTGLPPKEQLAIIENPACIPLPELSEAAVASIDKAVELAGEALGKLPSMIEVENMMATVSESGALTEPHMVALREAYNLCKDEYKVRTEKDKGEVNELGGLHIIGTERHESRRIDQQLRGRAGRQGDPGSSRFFLALDDKLFQVFGGSSIDGLLKTLRVEEDMPLEAQSVSDSLNRVQKNVEEYFYGIRKEMFKYDEILSTQREALYALRRRMVARPADADEEDDSIQATMLEYCIKTADEIVPNYVKDNGVDAEGLAKKLQQFFAGIDLSSDAIAAVPKGELAQMVRDKVEDALDSKEAQLDAAKEGFAVEIERYIALTQVDNLWKQHLKDMDFLKEFVGLRSYKQSDPFEDYQVEGYEIFQEMLDGVRRNTVYSLFQYELKDEANKAKAKDAKGKKKKKKSKK